MAKNNTRGGKDRSAFPFDTARDNPLVTAAAVGGAVAAGVFLWSRRNQISDQLSYLSDQISEWRDGLRSGGMDSDFEVAADGDETMSSASGSTAARRSSGQNRRKRGRKNAGADARSTPTT